MCYSAQVWADYHHYVRLYGADIDIAVFYELYVRKRQGEKLKTGSTPFSRTLTIRPIEAMRSVHVEA